MVSFVSLFPSLVCLGGCCAQPKPMISPTPKQYTSYLAAVNGRPAFQRFVLVNRTSERGDDARGLGAYALDTVTGQLCRTYPLDDPKAKLLPLCRDLWMNTTKDTLGLIRTRIKATTVKSGTRLDFLAEKYKPWIFKFVYQENLEFEPPIPSGFDWGAVTLSSSRASVLEIRKIHEKRKKVSYGRY